MAEPEVLLSIVLPTRNERLNAPELVVELLEAFRAAWRDQPSQDNAVALEIILVDASEDDTMAAVQESWAGRRETTDPAPTPDAVLCCHRQQSHGFSSAVGEGMSRARGRWLLCMNSDRQHRACDAVALFEARRTNTLLIGSRFVRGGATPYSLIRQLMSQLGSSLVAVISGVQLRDCFSSFFLLERERISGLDVHAIVNGRGEGMLNLAACLTRQGVALKEVPIRTAARPAGESKTDLLVFLSSYLQAAMRLRRQRPVRKRVHVLVRVIPLLVLVGLIIQNPASLRQFLSHPAAVVACGSVLILCTLLRAVRWQQIARVAGLKQPFWAALHDVAHGRLMSELLPVRVGEVVRISRIQTRDGLAMTPVLFCLLWEKISGFGIGLLGFGVLYCLARLRPEADFAMVGGGLAASVTVLASTLVWGGLIAGVHLCQDRLTRLRWGPLLQGLVAELRVVQIRCTGRDWSVALPLEPLFYVASIVGRRMMGIPLHSVFATSIVGYGIWSCTAISLALLAQALGLPVSLLEAGAAAFAAGVFSQVRLLPQAFGQPELAIALVLTSFGHPAASSVLLATADVLLQRMVTILLGVLILERRTPVAPLLKQDELR